MFCDFLCKLRRKDSSIPVYTDRGGEKRFSVHNEYNYLQKPKQFALAATVGGVTPEGSQSMSQAASGSSVVKLHRSFFLLLCVFVHLQNISKSIEPFNLIFGGSLPSAQMRKPFDF